jgi:glycosyltransferase involved in cell wall biosynthesis
MTVAVATYNSEHRLPALFSSIHSQVAPEADAEIEILVVDGGSTDESVRVAEGLGATVINNRHGDPIHAKALALFRANSRRVCFLDHDERFEKDDSLLRKYVLMERDDSVRIALPSGYRIDSEMRSCNAYASEFGDPFSCFFYRTPNDASRRVSAFVHRSDICGAAEGVFVLRPRSSRVPLLCEAVAAASVVDADYFRQRFPDLEQNPMWIPHLYSMMVSGDSDARLAILEDDAVLHDTAESWGLVFRKVRWRLANAIGAGDVGEAGFLGRHENWAEFADSHARIRFRKVLFAVYVFGVVPILIDSMAMSVQRRRLGYLMHVPLAFALPYWGVKLRLGAMRNRKQERRRYGD